jgi:hypothetical protein
MHATKPRSSWARLFTLAACIATTSFLSACGTGNAFVGKVIEGPSSLVMTADDKDERFTGPGIAGAEAEVRATREGMSERSVGKVETDAEGNFKLNFTDKLTGETLSIIVSKAGHITAKGPVSIQTQGKKTLVVLKKLAK